MKYTLDIFLRNYKRDRKIFGDATKDIYEKFFELITDDKIIINESAIYDDTLYEGFLTEEEISEEIFTEWWIFGSKKNPLVADLEKQKSIKNAEAKDIQKDIDELNKIINKKEKLGREVGNLKKELASKQEKLGNVTQGYEETVQALNASVGINNATRNLNPKDLGVDAISADPISNEIPLPAPATDQAMLDATANAISNPKPLGFFGKLKEKISSLFSGETTLSSFIKQGFAWLTNPANMSKIILTGGGIATVIILLNILRKKRKNKQYKMLQKNALNAIEKQKENLGEDFFEDNEQILEELQKEYKIGYFNY